MRRALALLSCVLGIAFAGCSAVIMGSPTDERELIGNGSSRRDLVRRLGEPKISRSLMQTHLTDIQQLDSEVVSLMPSAYVFDPELGYKRLPSLEPITSMAVFEFRGRLGDDHRAGESVSLNLMTLGLAEIFLIPAAIAERARRDTLELTVWFDGGERAVAYKWSPASTK